VKVNRGTVAVALALSERAWETLRAAGQAGPPSLRDESQKRTASNIAMRASLPRFPSRPPMSGISRSMSYDEFCLPESRAKCGA